MKTTPPLHLVLTWICKWNIPSWSRFYKLLVSFNYTSEFSYRLLICEYKGLTDFHVALLTWCVYQTPTVVKTPQSGTAHSCSQWSSRHSVRGARSGSQSEIQLSLTSEKSSYTCGSTQEQQAVDHTEAELSISRTPVHDTGMGSLVWTAFSLSLSCILGL